MIHRPWVFICACLWPGLSARVARPRLGGHVLVRGDIPAQAWAWHPAVVAVVLLLCAIGCDGDGDGVGRGEVRVAAAADLRYAMDELVERFGQARSDITVSVTFGSSGLFAGQIQNRAPFDLFLSADVEYPRRLIEAGIGSEAELFHYAVGRMVVWSKDEGIRMKDEGGRMKDEELGISSFILRFSSLLLDDRVRRVAIANPRHAPYGRAAEAALREAGVYEQVRGKLVLGENVAQAAQFVESGGADVAIVALSLVVGRSPPSPSHGSGHAGGLRHGWHIEIPEEMHPPIEQAGLVLPWARDGDAARAFRDFLLSEEGRAVLRAYGFRI